MKRVAHIGVLAVVLALILMALGDGTHTAKALPVNDVGFDADPSAGGLNTATSLGTIDPCISVNNTSTTLTAGITAFTNIAYLASSTGFAVGDRIMISSGLGVEVREVTGVDTTTPPDVSFGAIGGAAQPSITGHTTPGTVDAVAVVDLYIDSVQSPDTLFAFDVLFDYDDGIGLGVAPGTQSCGSACDVTTDAQGVPVAVIDVDYFLGSDSIPTSYSSGDVDAPIIYDVPDVTLDGSFLASANDIAGTEESGKGVLARMAFDPSNVTGAFDFPLDGATTKVTLASGTGPLATPTFFTDAVIAVNQACLSVGFADFELVETITVSSPQTVNTPFTGDVDINKTISNLDPTPSTPWVAGRVDITSDLDVPGDCTVTPDGANPTNSGLIATGGSVAITETFEVECTDSSFHQITSDNSIASDSPMVTDPDLDNNTCNALNASCTTPATASVAVEGVADFDVVDAAVIFGGSTATTGAIAASGVPVAFNVTVVSSTGFAIADSVLIDPAGGAGGPVPGTITFVDTTTPPDLTIQVAATPAFAAGVPIVEVFAAGVTTLPVADPTGGLDPLGFAALELVNIGTTGVGGGPEPVPKQLTSVTGAGTALGSITFLGQPTAVFHLAGEPVFQLGTLAAVSIEVGADVLEEVTVVKTVTNNGIDGPLGVDVLSAQVPNLSDGMKCMGGLSAGDIVVTGAATNVSNITDSPPPSIVIGATTLPTSPGQATGDISGVRFKLAAGATATVTEDYRVLCLAPGGDTKLTVAVTGGVTPTVTVEAGMGDEFLAGDTVRIGSAGTDGETLTVDPTTPGGNQVTFTANVALGHAIGDVVVVTSRTFNNVFINQVTPTDSTHVTDPNPVNDTQQIVQQTTASMRPWTPTLDVVIDSVNQVSDPTVPAGVADTCSKNLPCKKTITQEINAGGGTGDESFGSLFMGIPSTYVPDVATMGCSGGNDGSLLVHWTTPCAALGPAAYIDYEEADGLSISPNAQTSGELDLDLYLAQQNNCGLTNPADFLLVSQLIPVYEGALDAEVANSGPTPAWGDAQTALLNSAAWAEDIDPQIAAQLPDLKEKASLMFQAAGIPAAMADALAAATDVHRRDTLWIGGGIDQAIQLLTVNIGPVVQNATNNGYHAFGGFVVAVVLDDPDADADAYFSELTVAIVGGATNVLTVNSVNDFFGIQVGVGDELTIEKTSTGEELNYETVEVLSVAGLNITVDADPSTPAVDNLANNHAIGARVARVGIVPQTLIDEAGGVSATYPTPTTFKVDNNEQFDLFQPVVVSYGLGNAETRVITAIDTPNPGDITVSPGLAVFHGDNEPVVSATPAYKAGFDIGSVNDIDDDNDMILDMFDDDSTVVCTPYSAQITFVGETPSTEFDFGEACSTERPNTPPPPPGVMAFSYLELSSFDGAPHPNLRDSTASPAVFDLDSICSADADSDGIPDVSEPAGCLNLSEDADSKDTDGCPDTDQSVTDVKATSVAVGNDGTAETFNVTVDVTNGDYGSTAPLIGTGATDVQFDVALSLTPPALCTATWNLGGNTANESYTTAALDAAGVDSSTVSYDLSCTGAVGIRTATPMVSVATTINTTGVDHEGAPSGSVTDPTPGNFVDDDTTNNITVAVVDPVCVPDADDATVCLIKDETTEVAGATDPQHTKSFDVSVIVVNTTAGNPDLTVDLTAITTDPCSAEWDAGTPVALTSTDFTQVGNDNVAEAEYTETAMGAPETRINTVNYDMSCTAIPVPNPSYDQPFISAAVSSTGTDSNAGNSEYQNHVTVDVDSDYDGDSVGLSDNCPYIANPGQQDADDDDLGNACDDDDDADTIADSSDECNPGVGGVDPTPQPNLDDSEIPDLQLWQEDFDGDADGDGCREVDIGLDGGSSTVQVNAGVTEVYSETITVRNNDPATATPVDVLVQATSDDADSHGAQPIDCQVHIQNAEVDSHVGALHITILDNAIDIASLAPLAEEDITIDFDVDCADQGTDEAEIVFAVEAEPPVIDPTLATDTAPCTDVNVCNDTLIITSVGLADLELTSIGHTIAATMAVSDTPTVTVTANYINNGPDPIPETDFQVSITLDPPPDCTVDSQPKGQAVTKVSADGGPPAAPAVGDENENGVVDGVMAKNETGYVDQTFVIHCQEPSNHEFVISASISETDAYKDDPVSGNNSNSASKTVGLTAVTDLSASAVDTTCTSGCPPDVGDTFEIKVQGDVATSNPNGITMPVAADETLTLAAPSDCTAIATGGQSQSVSVNTGATAVSATWNVSCTDRSSHTFTGTVSITLDDPRVGDPADPGYPHLSDPDTNNSADDASPLSVGVEDEADLGVAASVTAGPTPATINLAVGTTATYEVTAVSSNAGPATLVDTDTDISGSVVTQPVGGGSSCGVSAGPATIDHNLGPDATDAHTFTVTCTITDSTTPDSVTVKGTGAIAFDSTEIHLSDPGPTANTDDTADVVISIIHDADFDGWDKHVDNCPTDYNPGQENDDGDSFGNACDSDPFHDVRVKPGMAVFGPAPVVITDTTGSYMWVIGEIGNDQGSGHTEQVDVSLSVTGVPSGCDLTGDDKPVLPPATTMNILENEQKPVVYRTNIVDGDSDCVQGQHTLTIELVIDHVDTGTGDECKDPAFNANETALEQGTTIVLCSFNGTTMVANNGQVATKQLLVVP